MGAAIAAAKVADEVGLTVSVIGTPAEEVGNAGGKIMLLERGGFRLAGTIPLGRAREAMGHYLVEAQPV